MDNGSAPRRTDPSRARTRVACLDRITFAREVKRALRRIDRPDMLLASPLLETHMVTQGRAGTAARERAARLHSLLREACRAVRENGDERGFAVLERTYLCPSVKQLAAADAVGLTFATYRRALASATDAVVEHLWTHETSGARLRLARPLAEPPEVPPRFVREIGEALRMLREPGALRDAHLESRIRRHCAMFARSPRDADVERVVRTTFFEGATSQREAAARLRIPYGTYRRYLAHAVERIATAIWFEERSGTETRNALASAPTADDLTKRAPRERSALLG